MSSLDPSNSHGRPHEVVVAGLQKVLDISRQLAVTANLDVLLGDIERAALEVLDCERATVCIYDKERDELFSCVATRSEEIRFPAGQGIAGEVFRTGKISNVPDAYAEPRFNRGVDAKTGFRTRNLLTCPLFGHNQEILGVLQALNRRNGSFDSWDETLIRTLSAQCGVAFQRHFLIQEHLEKQRLERDLSIAQSIQMALLPTKAPKVAGYEIAGWNQPAEETGGDFFDYRMLDDGRVLVIIADVTGHGMGPALVAAECHALMRATFSFQSNVEIGLTHVNTLLSEHLPEDRFVTALVGILKPETGEMIYTSAGQGPILFYKRSADRFDVFAGHGPPLGVMSFLPYDESSKLQFEQGDMLILMTDGFFEWESADRKVLGVEGFSNILRKHRDLAPAKIIEHMYEELMEFVPGTKQLDDLTAVIVKRV